MTRKKEEIEEVGPEVNVAIESAADDSAMRKTFEAWAVRERGFTEIVDRDKDGEYVTPWARAKWAEWQK